MGNSHVLTYITIISLSSSPIQLPVASGKDELTETTVVASGGGSAKKKAAPKKKAPKEKATQSFTSKEDAAAAQ